MPQRYVVLLPLLDDWVSLGRLIEDLCAAVHPSNTRFDIVVVDDGSVIPVEAAGLTQPAPGSCIRRVEVIRLALNVGHQRAIAIGLSAIADRTDLDGVVVMDSDGEDRPDDIPRLIREATSNPDHVVFARRARRSEGALFKAGYFVYKMMFRTLTGREISFGNFSVLPMHAVRRIVHMSELWNNLPATIIRSRLRYRVVHTARGVRYDGTSRMNLPALILHGLSAMAVWADVMFVRVLLAAGGICAATLSAMALVVGIRLATPLAIPGWATTVFGNLLIIMLLSLIIVVATTFTVLANRGNRPFVPIADTGVFIASRHVVVENRVQETVG